MIAVTEDAESLRDEPRLPDVPSVTTIVRMGACLRALTRALPRRPRLTQVKSWPIQAPSTSASPSLVGTAFDYYARMVLLQRYPGSPQGSCKARRGLDRLSTHRATAPAALAALEDAYARAKSSWTHASRSHGYGEDLIAACLVLAQLESAFRFPGSPALAEVVSDPQAALRWCNPDHSAIDDLWSLGLFMFPKLWTSGTPPFLNPDLRAGWAHGDPDLVADDVLLDFKSTKNLKLPTTYLHQMVCYLALWRVQRPDHPIRSICVYYTRFGRALNLSVDEYIDDYGMQVLMNEMRTGPGPAVRTLTPRST